MKFNLGDIVKIAREKLFMSGCYGTIIGTIEETREYIVGFYMVDDEGIETLYDEFYYYENELELMKWI